MQDNQLERKERAKAYKEERQMISSLLSSNGINTSLVQRFRPKEQYHSLDNYRKVNIDVWEMHIYEMTGFGMGSGEITETYCDYKLLTTKL